MAHNVIILGAGTSVQHGAPSMRTFLDVAQDLLWNGKVSVEKRAFENIQKVRSRLQQVHSKAEFDLVNIESVFTALEMERVLSTGIFQDIDPIDRLIDQLRIVIYRTIELSLFFEAVQVGSSKTIKKPKAHPEISDLLRRTRYVEQSKPFKNTAFFTFNYDLALDFAFAESGLTPDYGLNSDSIDSAHRLVPLLKLHGSIGWVQDLQASKIIPFPVTKWFSNCLIEAESSMQQVARIVQLTPEFQSGQHPLLGSQPFSPIPFIVPPSWNKGETHAKIGQVWKRAAKELREANSVFVIGYSLPETDGFFRHLYALGTVGEMSLRNFVVYNPDPTRESAFRGLVGAGVREGFRYKSLKVAEAMADIAAIIEK